MINLKFNNENAQAWFRSRLRRTAVVQTDARKREILEAIVDVSYGDELLLLDSDVRMVLDACEKHVGDDPALADGRQAIVDQLKEALS